MRVVISAQAEAELREIALFIARDNRPRALSFVRELRAKTLVIGNAPHAFPLVARYEHLGIRRLAHGNYLIFYRAGDEQVVILHILHAARDIEELL